MLKKMRNLSCTSIAGRLSLHTRSSRLIFLGELDILGKFLLIFVRTNLQSQIWAQTGGFRYGLCLNKKVGRRLIQKIKLETCSQKSPLARKILLLIFAVGRRGDKKRAEWKYLQHISRPIILSVCAIAEIYGAALYLLSKCGTAAILITSKRNILDIHERHSRTKMRK